MCIRDRYYNFLRLGHEGYTKVHSACYETAQFLAKEIAALGPFDMIYSGDPAEGIPALCWTIKPGKNPGYSLYDLADRLRVRGWQVPAYSMPAHREDLVVQRILVRLGVSRDLASILVGDIKAAIEYLIAHPVSVPATPQDATAFHH